MTDLRHDKGPVTQASPSEHFSYLETVRPPAHERDGTPQYQEKIDRVMSGEKNKNAISRRTVLGFGAGVLATAVGITTAVVVANRPKEVGAEPQPEPTASAPQTPGATAPSAETTPSPSAAETSAANSGAAEIERLKSLPIAQFNKLPREQRLKVALDEYDMIYSGRDGKTFYTDYFSDSMISGGLLADYLPVAKDESTGGELANRNNTRQQIMNQLIAQEQAVFCQEKNPAQNSENGLKDTMDKDAAKKMASGLYYYIEDGKRIPRANNTFRDIDAAQKAQWLGDTDYQAVDGGEALDLQTGKDREGKPIQYGDLRFEYKLDKFTYTVERRVVLLETDGVDGKSHQQWLIYSQKDVGARLTV